MNWASWLHGLYLFTTIFSVGVTAVDMLGLFGTGEGDSDTDADGADSGSDHIPLLSILRYLRIGVYFCLGFGPIGLVAEVAGASTLGSLAWALPGGAVAAWLARAFFRSQHEDVDSRVPEAELLLERAQVIVPISSENMGKVRVTMGQVVMERYAVAEDEWETLRTDDMVEIVRVTDDCVYVRRAI